MRKISPQSQNHFDDASVLAVETTTDSEVHGYIAALAILDKTLRAWRAHMGHQFELTPHFKLTFREN
ncbi:MAG: hypothetical protein KDA93_12410 [Planctomycetaceae bacterium]|nr:hypothetical protein [Planctomycetaceae bacterium]